MANVKITELPAVVTITPASDVIPLVSGGATKKATPTQMVNSVLNGTVNIGIGTSSPLNKVDIVGSLGRGAPTTKTADFTLAATENWLINNKAGSSCTVTLPAASLWTGREVMIQNYRAFTVISASANVIPIAGGSASTAILDATAGKRATLISNGTNWVIVDSN
jgi:hypothetical protein